MLNAQCSINTNETIKLDFLLATATKLDLITAPFEALEDQKPPSADRPRAGSFCLLPLAGISLMLVAWRRRR
jgi:hypothetical protein